MSSPWSILCSSGSVSTWTDPATLNLSAFRLSLSSQTPDRLTFTHDAAFDTAPLFPFDSILQLHLDTTLYFSGRVLEPERVGEPGQESLHYTVVGPWHDLARTVYQQLWKRYDEGEETLVDDYRSRVILCQSDAGARVNSGAQIIDALTFAISLGVNLQIGVIDPAIQIPWEEALDITCAEVIQRMLRWSPDAVCWFDYTTDPPTFHCRLRSNLTSLSLPATAASAALDVSSLNIVACRDLQVPGVLLRYERTDTIDEVPYSLITADTAGNPAAIGAVVSTIELAGATRTTLSQYIETEAWPNDPTDKDWWIKHVPRLADENKGTYTLSEVTIKDDLGNFLNTITYDRILTIGDVQPWMANVATLDVTVRARMRQAVYDDVTHTEVVKQDSIISFRCVATDAATGFEQCGVYKTTGSFVSGEPIPTGVAAALYAAWSILHWQGTFTLDEPEVGTRALIGRKLNLTGGLAAWATMDAIIQQVQEDLDTGRTAIMFGPPRQIAIPDLISLLSRFRSRRIATGWNMRTTGESGGGTEVNLGGVKPKNEPSEGSPNFRKIVMQHIEGTPAAETARLTLDVSAIKTTTPYKVLQVQDSGGIRQTVFDHLRAHS